MQKWLMIPYSINPATTPLQELFTERHIRGRICVERAFGVLKARFRILQVGITSSIGWAARIVQACCVLHNVLVKHRVGMFNIHGQTDQANATTGVNAERSGDSDLILLLKEGEKICSKVIDREQLELPTRKLWKTCLESSFGVLYNLRCPNHHLCRNIRFHTEQGGREGVQKSCHVKGPALLLQGFCEGLPRFCCRRLEM